QRLCSISCKTRTIHKSAPPPVDALEPATRAHHVPELRVSNTLKQIQAAKRGRLSEPVWTVIYATLFLQCRRRSLGYGPRGAGLARGFGRARVCNRDGNANCSEGARI